MNFLEAVEIASKSSFEHGDDYYFTCTIKCGISYCNLFGNRIDDSCLGVEDLLSNDWCVEFDECDWDDAQEILKQGGKINYKNDGYMHFVDDELVDQDGDPVRIKKDFLTRKWTATC